MRKLAISITIIAAACVLVLAFVLEACSDGLTDLPIETIEWEQLSDGSYQFYTNDPNYHDYYFWSLHTNTGDPTVFEIECKKVGGAYYYSYGMLFGVDNSLNNRYFQIVISNGGRYYIQKRIDGNYYKIQDWTASSRLKQGYNKTNNIKVIKNGTLYKVFFNGGDSVFQFNDSQSFGDRIGFLAWVGDDIDEKFPNKPVDVRFWLK